MYRCVRGTTTPRSHAAFRHRRSIWWHAHASLSKKKGMKEQRRGQCLTGEQATNVARQHRGDEKMTRKIWRAWRLMRMAWRRGMAGTLRRDRRAGDGDIGSLNDAIVMSASSGMHWYVRHLLRRCDNSAQRTRQTSKRKAAA